MAPSVLPVTETSAHDPVKPAEVAPTDPPADKRYFPDGLKTSGQHPALEDAIFSYEDFPKQISGPTVWTKSDYQNHPDRWTHPFTQEEISELSEASDQFIESGAPLTGLTRALFHLPTLGPFLDKLRTELVDGRGFILFKGLPVDQWSNLKCAVAYIGIGSHFGYATSQNRHGHILGHVQNLAEDPKKYGDIPVRIYRTTARQYFHTDGTDMVGLLCMAKAMEGGESDIASTHAIFNTLQQEHPEVVKTFVKNNWFFDRKGEMSQGQGPYYRSAVWFLENDPNPATRRMFSRFDPMNVTTLARYNTGPNAEIPPLNDEQKFAMEKLEETAKRLSLHMILDPGDIQFLHNAQVYHARTAYTDWPHGSADEKGELRKQRQLMRLWMALPEQEGGWKLPYKDSKQKKRGGVQVDDQPPSCPLAAE